MDDYGTHKVPKVARWFVRHPRYHLHFTPTSASWLNQVERFFAQITTQRIDAGRSTASVHSKLRWTATWFITMRSADRSSGPRPLMRSSTRSSGSANEFQRHDISLGTAR